jgi:hypothetical protein
VLADPVTGLSLPLAVTRPIIIGYHQTTDYLVQSCPVDGISLWQD